MAFILGGFYLYSFPVAMGHKKNSGKKDVLFAAFCSGALGWIIIIALSIIGIVRISGCKAVLEESVRRGCSNYVANSKDYKEILPKALLLATLREWGS